jgi:hypothetical protein
MALGSTIPSPALAETYRGMRAYVPGATLSAVTRSARIRHDRAVIEDDIAALSHLFRTHDEKRLADWLDSQLEGDPATLSQRVRDMFRHGMGGLMDPALYTDGKVDREATARRDELAERLFEAAKPHVK